MPSEFVLEATNYTADFILKPEDQWPILLCMHSDQYKDFPPITKNMVQYTQYEIYP